MSKLLRLMLFCCIPLLLYGCGPANPYGTVVVTGQVTVDGAPMEGVTISFLPTGEGMAAVGMTDSSGNFKLTTGGAPFGTGAVPGTYSVTFSKVESATARLSLDDQAAGKLLRGSSPPQPIYHLPQKFSDPTTTGFDPVKVVARDKNNFDFNLITAK